MDLNAAGLTRILQMAQRSGEAGRRLADQFTEDALVTSLLLLYGLHPNDLETRVRGAHDNTQRAPFGSGSKEAVTAAPRRR